ncbi:MAG: DUF3891 family protein [Anaerolineales bacterium]
MILQAAGAGEPQFVIRQVDHARLAGRLAEAFGNSDFDPPQPREHMLFVTTHHDDGWAELDAAPPRAPHTDLPYQFTETPAALLVGIHAASPDINEAHDQFCGLLASMHTWGLYNGRFGLSEQPSAHTLSPADRPAVQRMLQGELARQRHLQGHLAADPATATWVEDAYLFYCYQLLQFFDRLSLYFSLSDPARPAPATFKRVPRAPGVEAAIRLHPLRPGFYGLAPYPFAQDFLELHLTGRYLLPVPPQADLVEALSDMTDERQRITLVAGTEDAG